MNTLLCCFLFVAILTITNGQKPGNRGDVLSISSGVSFGMCRGYCRRSIKITPSPYEVLSFKEPNYPQDEFPPAIKAQPFTVDQWKALIDLVDVSAFQSLDDRIGCPDCADGGAEWIEIQVGGQMKRVTFENGRLIKGFEGLVVQLRDLRNQYTNDL